MSAESPQKILNEENEIEVFFPKDHNLKRWGMLISGGMLILTASVFVTLIALNTYTSVLRHGRAVLLNKITAIFPMVLILIPIGLLLILWAKNHWEDQLILNESGLFQKKGKKEQSWHWDETEKLDTIITEIQFGGSSVGTRVKLLLTGTNKKKWLIRNRYENILDLVDHIREKVLPDLYHQAKQNLAHNQEIEFHTSLIASKEGLRFVDQQIPWDEQIISQVKGNNLIIKNQENQEPLFKTKLRKIKNLDLLLCLVENPPDLSI
ncbi:MAG: hypothetical protein RQ728_03660 [Brevefilum sp.]|nr:hypothetical protein [Brevefilum sp.]